MVFLERCFLKIYACFAALSLATKPWHIHELCDLFHHSSNNDHVVGYSLSVSGIGDSGGHLFLNRCSSRPLSHFRYAAVRGLSHDGEYPNNHWWNADIPHGCCTRKIRVVAQSNLAGSSASLGPIGPHLCHLFPSPLATDAPCGRPLVKHLRSQSCKIDK